MRLFAQSALIGCAAAAAYSRKADCPVANLNQVVHTGTPVGQIKNISGVQTYISPPKSGKPDNVIIFMTDIYGIPAANNTLLADNFARAGYYVVVPDYFKGDPVPLTGPINMTAWFARHPDTEIDGIVASTINYIRTTLGAKRLGAVGYCFGGKFVARYLAKGKGVDVGFFAHPSRLTNDEIKAIASPISIGAAGNDSNYPVAQRHDTEDILLASKLPYQINLYGGVGHGFGVRADVTNKTQRYVKEQAYLQAVTWFDTWLKPSNGTA